MRGLAPKLVASAILGGLMTIRAGADGDPPAAWVNAATVSLSGLKVTLSQPVCVARSTNWLWFPTLFKLSDGRIALSAKADPDAVGLGVPGHIFFSSNGGLAWQAGAYTDPSFCGLELANGDHLLLPFYLQADGGDPMRMVGGYHLIRAGQSQVEQHADGIRVSGFPRQPKGDLGSCAFDGQPLRLADGTYLAPLYGYFQGAGKCSQLLAESTNGFDWTVRATIAADDGPYAGVEGPCEGTVARLADGRLMAVYRVNSTALYGQTFSADEGRTWTPAAAIAGPFSVEPSLYVRPDGLVALSGGRAGVWLWLNQDGDGLSWQAVNIRTHHNQFVPAEPISEEVGWNQRTTGYTEIVPLDATNLLLVYDRIPGGHNQPPPAGESNSVWAVRVTVERVASAWSGAIAHEGRVDPTKAMDVHSDYHTYKMVMRQGATDAADKVDVYVDGVLAKTLTRADVLDYPYPRDVAWGDGSSYSGKSVDARFNYVRFDSHPYTGTVISIQ